MSITVEFTPNKEFLYVSLSGVFSLSEANKSLVKIFREVAANKSKKVLVDCRNLKGEPTTFERFEHSAFAADELIKYVSAGGSNRARFAYVGDAPLFDPNRFGETVAINRGIDVLTTDSIEKAMVWLQVDHKILSV